MIPCRMLALLIAAALLAGCTLDFGVEAGQADATATKPPVTRTLGEAATARVVPTATARPTRTARPTATDDPTATESPAVPVRSSGGSAPRATARPTTQPTALPTSRPTPLPPATVPPDPEAARIESFTLAPASTGGGQTVTLSWEAAGQSASIRTDLPDGAAGETYSGLPLEGTLDVAVEGDDGDEIIYVLSVSGAGGTADTARAALLVGSCADWFFEPAPDGCPRGPAEIHASAIQYFQRGFMIWDADSTSIWVFYADSAGGWNHFTDGWMEGLPESDPRIEPPDGLYQPVRGFGLVWRTLASSSGTVRDRLGWATGPEFAYTRTEQLAASAEDANLNVYAYISRDDGEVIVLLKGAWALWPDVP